MTTPRTPHDPGGSIQLRPHSATAICVFVGVIGLGLGLDAVLRVGEGGLLVLPALLFVLALVWMVLWAPRVVLHEDTVEVRNVLVTHHLPFAVIEEVRLGAMLRFEVRTRRGDTSTITAWNAPALGRESPIRREAAIREQGLRGPRATPQQRLVEDQQRSRSAVVKQRWERWMDRHDGQAVPAADAAGVEMTTRPNLVPIIVVAVLGLLTLARAVL